MSVVDVVDEIGAVGQAEKIRRSRVHADGLGEVQHIHSHTALMSAVDSWQEPVEYQAIRCPLQVRRTLQMGFGVDLRDHPFPHGVRLVFQHGEGVGDAIVHKGIKVPSVLLEAPDIHGPQRIRTVDADLIGCKSYHGTMFFMESAESADSCPVSPLSEPDPERKDGGCEVGIWDL